MRPGEKYISKRYADAIEGVVIDPMSTVETMPEQTLPDSIITVVPEYNRETAINDILIAKAYLLETISASDLNVAIDWYGADFSIASEDEFVAYLQQDADPNIVFELLEAITSEAVLRGLPADTFTSEAVVGRAVPDVVEEDVESKGEVLEGRVENLEEEFYDNRKVKVDAKEDETDEEKAKREEKEAKEKEADKKGKEEGDKKEDSLDHPKVRQIPLQVIGRLADGKYHITLDGILHSFDMTDGQEKEFKNVLRGSAQDAIMHLDKTFGISNDNVGKESMDLMRAIYRGSVFNVKDSFYLMTMDGHYTVFKALDKDMKFSSKFGDATETLKYAKHAGATPIDVSFDSFKIFDGRSLDSLQADETPEMHVSDYSVVVKVGDKKITFFEPALYKMDMQEDGSEVIPNTVKEGVEEPTEEELLLLNDPALEEQVKQIEETGKTITDAIDEDRLMKVQLSDIKSALKKKSGNDDKFKEFEKTLKGLKGEEKRKKVQAKFSSVMKSKDSLSATDARANDGVLGEGILGAGKGGYRTVIGEYFDDKTEATMYGYEILYTDHESGEEYQIAFKNGYDKQVYAESDAEKIWDGIKSKILVDAPKVSDLLAQEAEEAAKALEAMSKEIIDTTE